MIMGVHRSGTTALYKALRSDERFGRFHELDAPAEGNPFYNKLMLRPYSKVKAFLQAWDRPSLLKPVAESSKRSVESVMREWKQTDLAVVWIYRDPIWVFRARHIRNPKGYPLDKSGTHRNSPAEFARFWCRCNQQVFAAAKARPHRVTVVDYDDLCASPLLFGKVCSKLRMTCENLFEVRERSLDLPGWACDQVSKVSSAVNSRLSSIKMAI